MFFSMLRIPLAMLDVWISSVVAQALRKPHEPQKKRVYTKLAAAPSGAPQAGCLKDPCTHHRSIALRVQSPQAQNTS